MITSSNINIICSNDTRNGKTLLSRVFVDYLALIGRTAKVFDTDGSRNGIAAYFPAQSQVVDISKTMGQVQLFDSILAEPQHDFVIDLSSRHFEEFFQVFSDIDFEEGALEAGLRIAVYYMVEPSAASVLAAVDIRKRLKHSKLIPVRNETLRDVMKVPAAAANYHLVKPNRELTLPALGRKAANYVSEPDFSFQNLFSEEFADMPPKPKGQLCDFLEILHKQFQSVQLTNDLADLRLQGVL